MVVTSATVIRPKSQGPVLAFVELELDGAITIRNMRIMKSSNPDRPYHLVMPRIGNASGVMRDIYHPINNEARDILTDAAITCYKDAVDKGAFRHTMALSEKGDEPSFSDLSVYRFPGTGRRRANVSFLYGGAVLFTNASVVLNDRNQALTLNIPMYSLAWQSSVPYYHFDQDTYQDLYEQVMTKYSNENLAG